MSVADIVLGDFEWEDRKAAINVRDHGVTFVDAADALANDPSEFTEADVRDPTRVASLVLNRDGEVLWVLSTDTGTRTRIISARKAESDEQRKYFERQ